ncbi:DUF4389 domain-containing protein [Candidatus Neomarinimicrobiota bacterium]
MENYPVSLSIDYSEKSNRVTVLFRLFLAIPILIILVLLTSSGYDTEHATKEMGHVHYVGILFLPTLLMIVFMRKYPKWWFDWNLALTKFSIRVFSYLLLLRDEYPSTDEEQAVNVEINYPDVEKDLNQWLPLVKWLLAIPHYIVLILILIGVIISTILAWFIILFTGKYPKSMFDFVVGFLRWALRVNAYAILLTTDEYPPFSLSN